MGKKPINIINQISLLHSTNKIDLNNFMEIEGQNHRFLLYSLDLLVYSVKLDFFYMDLLVLIRLQNRCVIESKCVIIIIFVSCKKSQGFHHHLTG